MPSCWEQLPQELLESIIEKIGDDSVTISEIVRNESLLQLLLTCKRWSSIAREAFYNQEFEINLDLAKQLTTSGIPGQSQLWLKKVRITYNLAIDASLKKLLSMCPYLTHLRVLEDSCDDSTSSNSSEASDSANEGDSTYPRDARENFYITLANLSCDHHLVNLQEVEFRLKGLRESQLLQCHQRAMFQLRHSLTHLYIPEDTKYYESERFSKQLTWWFDTLQDFACLTSLELHLSYRLGLDRIEPWTKKMGPHVTTLSVIVENEPPPVYLNRVDLATVVPHTPLKLLHLCVDDLQPEDIKYIARKFDRLLDLQIKGEETTYCLWRLYEYLTRIPNYSIQGMCISVSRLKAVIEDLKEYFCIVRLHFSGRWIGLEPHTIQVSLKCLTKPKDGDRRQAYLKLAVNARKLASCVQLACEVLDEDVLELDICHGMEEEQHQEFDACTYQGEAVCFGLSLLPSLKTLTASCPRITSMTSIVNLRLPKLSLNHLQLGNYADLSVLFQISQRVQHIEKYVAPEFTFYDVYGDRYMYLLRMPYTTFGEIKINSVYANRFIIALSTSTSTTYHGVGVGSDLALPTEDDFLSDDDDNDKEEEEEVYDPDNVGRIIIVCFDVKKIKIGFTTIMNE
ncbi:unnamed protein product [Mucor fragilis]